MAWKLQSTIKLKSISGLQNTDHMPRRRKRLYGKMSLMLLIFVSCCLTLMFKPLHVKAKELNNTTSKGENMLSNDLQSHQHKEGEVNINADKTNDNGTFKRLQATTGIKMENKYSVEEEEEDEHSTEVIEMIQPTHNLRHQEHYKQRILQAEKHKQQKHHLDFENANVDGVDDDDDDDADDEEGDDDIEVQERELSQYNRNLRYKQIQQALREPIASVAPHHRRHEHHLAVKQHWAKQTDLTWPNQQQQQKQHHLRHQHQHHQQQQAQELQHQPQLRHFKHEMRKQNITNTKIKSLLHQRYFDRESSYINPMTTEGPQLRHSSSSLHWKPVAYSNNPHNHLYNDDSSYHQQKTEDIKRFSLPLHDHENENTNKHKPALQESTLNDNDDGDSAINDDSDSDTDYSYEDDDVNGKEHKETNKPNNYHSIMSYTKTNVKRYTNPLKQLHKPSSLFSSSASASATFAQRQQNAGHHLKHMPASHSKNIFKTNTNNDNENNDDYDDDIEKNEEDIENSSNTSQESSDDDGDGDAADDDDKMSDEKWNKIEHEHYRKQLQHQRAMQALRSRRPQNDNTQQHTAAAAAATITTTTINNNKYSSYSPSSLSAASTNNAAWKKRQAINEDESGNIYSRYYVPGAVTHKKETELGSPTAILESRRQYALQQRQNKALASAHHRRIVTEGSCRLPQPRVERIRRDSWKIYTPHCTILHRCADDSGCCPSERQTCAPKRTKNVDLFFFVISLNETQGSIEKLSFVNHTECHCINRSKQRAPEYANAGAKDLVAFNNQIPYLRRATILNCFCPNLFEKILQEDGYCRCDCSSGNTGCDWLKRGMEHFSMNDRKCIIEGRCKLPTCEYGQYIKKHGRCPRREERHLSADIEW